jgi:hypothetical protein
MRRAVFIGLALIVLAGCAGENEPRLGTSRSASFDTASLVTQFFKPRGRDQERALFHILFVPVVQPAPDSAVGTNGSHGGTPEHKKFNARYTFTGPSEKISIQSHTIDVRESKTLEAEGQSFPFTNGTVFIARVERDGRLQVRQLPVKAETGDSDPKAVLELIKQLSPNDALVQGLKAQD